MEGSGQGAAGLQESSLSGRLSVKGLRFRSIWKNQGKIRKPLNNYTYSSVVTAVDLCLFLQEAKTTNLKIGHEI